VYVSERLLCGTVKKQTGTKNQKDEKIPLKICVEKTFLSILLLDSQNTHKSGIRHLGVGMQTKKLK